MYAYCTSSHMSKQFKKNGQSNITIMASQNSHQILYTVIHVYIFLCITA